MKEFKAIKTYTTFSRNVQIMVLSELALAFAFGIYSFLQILYLNDINIPSDQIGVIFSIGSLFSMVGFFLGPFMSILGRKTILLIGCLLSALGIGSYILFTNFFLLLISQILINIGLCFIQVTELQLLYSYTTPDKECCAYSYKSSVNFIASTLGGLVAGNINKFPLFKDIGYRKLFFLSVILILFAFTLRLFLLPRDKRIKAHNGMMKNSINNTISLLKSHKSMRIFAIFLFIIAIGGSAVWPYNNLILKNQFVLSNTYISIINFIITTLNMTGILIMPTIIEKFSIKTFEVVSLISLATSMLLLSFNLSKIFFIIMLISRAAFACLVGSSLDSSMMSHIELDNRDVFAGVKLLVNSIACAIGNFIGGFIIENINFRGIYIYGFCVLIIVITFFYIKVSKLFDPSIIIERYHRNCKCRLHHKYIERKR
ncbi:MFS transporter [Clostridium cuniculi]|uniref:MFS transporter n=1 Tax=Clostridium cuniculi TaxID=2548455 RepID=UPI001055F521|nr:MFS transporter [Clostridium cuniculi]